MLTSGETSFPLSQEISLYFHIPFCTKKCHYCHFFVLPDKKQYHKQLIDALLLDVTQRAPDLVGKKIVSIYFGGGTPSLLDPEEIACLLEKVRSIVPFNLETAVQDDEVMQDFESESLLVGGDYGSKDCVNSSSSTAVSRFNSRNIEITLEANPETVTLQRMQAFAAAGINRVSIGVQSLEDGLLQKLGRTHDAAASVNAIMTTAEAGISNISIDLMYDIPGQNLASWRHTLMAITPLPITHLSLYNLTIEPHTVFFKYQEKLRQELPDADSSAEMYRTAQSILNDSGLIQYEISAFEKGNAYSRHNVGYWTGRPFLGFGPSAFSYWERRRFRAVSNLNRYAEALQKGLPPEDFSELLPPEAQRRELLAIALRLMRGVDMQRLIVDEATRKTIEKLITEGLLVNEDGMLKLTERGILFYDTVAVELI